MGKKSIINPNNPALALLQGTMGTPAKEEVKQKQEETPKPAKVRSQKPAVRRAKADGVNLYTTKKERKTERLQLLITPSLEAKLNRMKEETGQSANDFINQVLEDVLKEF